MNKAFQLIDFIYQKGKRLNVPYNCVATIHFFVFIVVGFTTSAQPIEFCGIAPAHSANSQSIDSIYYDRFGNSYDRVVLDAEFNSLSASRSVIGYFDLRYQLSNAAYIPVIEDVFDYISSILEQRSVLTGCSDLISPASVRILIKESSEVDDPIQATGSPNYFALVNRANCDDVISDRVNMKMNGGLNDFGVDGMITLNDDPDYDWYLGSGTPSSTQLDFFTIILHEALHVFGFASRLTSDGNALDGAYSFWDQLIFTTTGYVNGGPSPDIEPLITSDCEENCWSLNDETFADAEDFVDALSDNCSTGGAIDFIFGSDGLAPLQGGSGGVGNALSHLHKTCNGQNIDYVMLPGLSLMETKRMVTTPELNILCRFGYKTASCDQCFLTALPEDIRVITFESCCETFFSACEDQELFLDFDDLLCNDKSNNFTPEITDYFLQPNSALQVTVTSTGFSITPTEQGNHTLYYTVKGCDCRLLNTRVYIYTGPCTECEEVDPCENLVCIDDFEDFETQNGANSVHVQALGDFWLSEIGDNSVDICESSTGNHYLQIGSHPSNREGLIMKLSEPLDPGCTLHVTFDASAAEPNRYQWFVSSEAPCSYNIENINTNGQAVDCGTYLFEPFLIRNIDILNTANSLNGLCAQDPNFIQYEFQWPNGFDIEVNYLILFPGPKNNQQPFNYLDNIYVTKDCLDPEFEYVVDAENCFEIEFLPIFLHPTVQHNWNFGDTYTSQDISPIHEYSTGGSFVVTHTVSDDCGNSASSSKELVLDCCEDYTVTTTTTWTTTGSIPNNGVFKILTVAHGVFLTVDSGVELKFCPDGALVVEEGAFVRNKGTLTSLGDFSWNGVYVTGIPTANQLYDCITYSTSYNCVPQGTYLGTAGSIIEDAKIGLRNYGPGPNNTHGGILKGDGAIFRNNGIGVDFKDYNNFYDNQPRLNISSFIECIFENTSGYLIPEAFTHFIRMEGVNGIKIKGCEFDNDLMPSNAQHYEDFGRGIYALNAGFQAIPNSSVAPCLPPTTCGNKNTFNGLGYGIYVTNTTASRPYSIIQAEFENCWRPITSDGSSGGTIIFNTIKLGTTPQQFAFDPEDQIGIQLQNNHAGFQIQENEVIYTSGGTTFAIGSRCYDTGTANNTIRRNSYDGLNIVHEAFGINALNSEINSGGLVYLCEEISNTQLKGFDFYIAETGGIDNIYYQQGIPLFNPVFMAAGNQFAYTATDIQNNNDPLLDAESIFYHWYDAGNQEPLTGSGYSAFESEHENACISDYCVPPCIGPGDIADIKAEYFDHISQLEQDIDDYWIAIGNSNYSVAEEKNLSAIFQSRNAFQKAYDLVQYYWHDTVTFNFDTLIDWYGRLNSFGSDIMIGGEIANKYDFGTAIDYLEDIPVVRDLTPEQEVDLDRVIQIYGMLDTTSISALTSAQKSIIRSIAQDSKGRSSGMARAILHCFGENYPLPYYKAELYDPPLQRRSDETPDHEEIFSPSFKLFPVPASDRLIFQWLNEEEIGSDRTIFVYNCLGQEVMHEVIKIGQTIKELDISQLAPGLYIIASSVLDKGGTSIKFIKE